MRGNLVQSWSRVQTLGILTVRRGIINMEREGDRMKPVVLKV